jgi:redox-sensitive bicupin YhaK (pirin superfamily)
MFHFLLIQGNGVSAFVLNGELVTEGQRLRIRDEFGIWDTETINVRADSTAEVLLMEVPMELQ